MIVGLDLSLTATGMAFINDAGVHTCRFTSKGKADASLFARTERLTKLARDIVDATAGAELVVVEQPAFSKIQGQAHDRSGLWWLVVSQLYTTRVAEVPPTTLKRYATGKGNASKDEVLAAVVRRYIDLAQPADNNEADALVCAAMGARWLGEEIELNLPKGQAEAVEKVRWPT